MSTGLTSTPSNGVAILDRVFEPGDVCLSVDAARSLMSLKFQKADERRMDRLAAKARKGTLTDTERFKAEQYNMVSHLLALLQIKARQAMQEHSQETT